MKRIVRTMDKLNWGNRASAVFVLCAVTAIALPAQTLTTLFNFDGTNGGDPQAGLVQATNGDFYGTTWVDGTHSGGTVFKVTPSGTGTTLYSFCSLANCADGKNPVAGLVQATKGDLYGTTTNGGANNSGTVFKITPSGTLTSLHSFCSLPNCADGNFPHAGLIKGRNFFPGTSVKIGPVVFTEGNGLTIQSDQTMILNTSLASASQGDGVVTGRYGAAVPLAPTAYYQGPGIAPLRIDSISVYPGGLTSQLCGFQTSCVDILLTRDGGLQSVNLPNGAPSVSYNGVLLTGQQTIVDVAGEDVAGNKIRVSMKMPTATLGNATGVFTVKFPFQGPAWIAKGSFADPLAVDLQRVDMDSKSTMMIYNRNRKFDGPWRIILDQVYTVDQPDPRQPHSTSLVLVTPCVAGIVEPNCHLMQFTVDKSLLDNWKQLTIVAPNGSLRVYPTPASSSTPPPGKAALDPKLITPVVRQGQVKNITYKGQSLDQITKVTFNSKDLNFVHSADGTSLTVMLTSDVTATAGDMQLTLQVDAQTVLSAPLTVLSKDAPSAADPAKKAN